jgi:hypothetical protein
MQYTATSFSMPIRRILGFMFDIREQVDLTHPVNHAVFPERIRYRLRIRDRFWNMLYVPIVNSCFWLSRKVGKLQQGRIQVYLLYSFITLIVLLALLR